jgi:DNA processing protein
VPSAAERVREERGSRTGEDNPFGRRGGVTEREAALVVATARGVGPAKAAELLKAFGSYRGAVQAALGKNGRESRIPLGVRASIRESASERTLGAELERARKAGARFAIAGDPDYPALLSEIARAPVGIYVQGRRLPELVPMFAIVGTRSPTPRGRAVAFELASGLASRGITVVSGLARGVDTEAHRGALESGGATVAVLGSGIDRLYPPENDELANEIAQSGAVVSEFPMWQEAKPGLFPRRNRIVSGLSIGIVVVEAAERSGALITASFALEQGREVFAVPGPVDEPLSRGPNGLIKAGARLVEDASDIIEELLPAWGPFRPPVGQGAATACGAGAPGAPGERSQRAGGSGLPEQVLRALSLKPTSPDEISAEVGAAIPAVLAALLELEIAGTIRACPGGRYVRAVRSRDRVERAEE